MLRRRALVVAGFTALAVALLHEATLSGGALFRRDLSLVWYPMVEAFVRCVAAGSLPFWDPWRGFGQPLLADARAALWYPPTWLNLIVPPWLYQTWFACAHLVLAACGAHALIRRLGASPPASFAGAALWLASGPLVSLAGQFHHLAGAAWLPVVLACGLRVLERPAGRHVVLLALALALQVVAGSPDYTAVTGLILGALAVLRVLRSPADWRRPLAGVSAGVLLGLMLSAVQWFPTLQLARGSARWGQALEGAQVWALHPLRLLELLLPIRFVELPLEPELAAMLFDGREPYLASIYCGALVLVLACAAKGAGVGPSIGLALAGAILALGTHTPFYTALVTVVPPLRVLRYPEKVIVVAALAMSVLAGLGIDAIAAGHSARRRARAAALAVAAVSGLLLLWISLPSARSLPAYTGVLALGAAWLLGSRWQPSRQATLVAALALADLFAGHHRLNPAAPMALFTTRPSPLQHLGSRDDARLYAYDYSQRFPSAGHERPGAERYALARVPEAWRPDAGLFLGVLDYMNPPTAERWGIRGSFDGDIVDLYPSYLRRLVDRLREVEGDAGHGRLLRLGGVTHVLTLHDAEWTRDLERLATLPGLFREPIRVFAVPSPLPRAYVVGGVRVAPDDSAARILTSADFVAEGEIVVPSGTAVPARAVQARIEVLAWKPDRIEWALSLEQDGFVVATESFAPGWRATLDGRPAEIVRANLAFRAVAVPSGEHRLEMQYEPPGLRAGAAASVAAMALLALVWGQWRA